MASEVVHRYSPGSEVIVDKHHRGKIVDLIPVSPGVCVPQYIVWIPEGNLFPRVVVGERAIRVLSTGDLEFARIQEDAHYLISRCSENGGYWTRIKSNAATWDSLGESVLSARNAALASVLVLHVWLLDHCCTIASEDPLRQAIEAFFSVYGKLPGKPLG